MPLNPKFENLLKTDFESLYSLGVEKLREYYSKSWDDFKGISEEVGSVVNRVIKTSIRDTPIRVYYPKTTGIYPALIFIHGGGFVLGNIDVYDPICRKITNNVNCAVISIDYGLAPEHKFPKPMEECYQVTKWVFENADELHVNPDTIAIGGDSVGGTLSAHCNETVQKAIRPRCCQIAMKMTKKALRKYRKTFEISMATPAGFEPATF